MCIVFPFSSYHQEDIELENTLFLHILLPTRYALSSSFGYQAPLSQETSSAFAILQILNHRRIVVVKSSRQASSDGKEKNRTYKVFMKASWLSRGCDR